MNYKRPLSRAEKRALQSTLEKFYTRHFNEHCKGTIPVLETLSTQLKGTLEELFQIMFAMLDVADIDERRTWSDKKGAAFQERIDRLLEEERHEEARKLTIRYHLFHFTIRLMEIHYLRIRETIHSMKEHQEELEEMEAVNNLNDILESYGIGINNRGKINWLNDNDLSAS